MLLSRLEISGFKSFPERTILKFDGGITGVVGPNGCGKSNILDSIRWVLGEQRTNVLRSSRMEDVIFSGTSQLKATGMAEVNLTIKNHQGILPIDYEDVVITRRLFRSGESEYLLNKSRCRLRDIVELFYDTGMGPHAYSVIQQGMIDIILSDRAEDRRSLFEEAAGVTKYKHRKKEAEDKLQATESDLLRLGDIISEIEKQVISLRRQAKRARGYADKKETLKNVELLLAAGMLFNSQEQYNELLDRKKGSEIEIEANKADKERLELDLQRLKLKSSELESEASDYRRAESDSTIKATEIESEIKLGKQRIDSFKAQIENSNTEIAALEKRIKSLKGENEDKQARLGELDREKASLTAECQSLETQLATTTEKLAGAETALEEKRGVHSEISERRSGIKAEAASLDEMKRSLLQKMEEIKKETEGFDEFRNEAEGRIGDLENDRSNLISCLEGLLTERKSKSTEVSGLTEAISVLREKLSSEKAELSGIRARRELLEQLIETGEGYSKGARALMSWPDKPAGMLMPVAEVLDVRERYRTAVSAALGDMGEIIPVGNYSEAREAIDYLKKNGGGRASFLILDKLDESRYDGPRPDGVSGFIGYLDEVIRHPGQYKPVIKLLLSRVALFDSEKAALGVGNEWDYFTRVTLDGLVILPSGIVSGGRTVGGALGRRQDLKAIEERQAEISAEIRGMEAELQERLDKQNKIQEELGQNESTINQMKEKKDELDAELDQLRFSFREKENRYTAAVVEIGRLENEIQSFDEKLNRLSAELERLKGDSEKSATAFDGLSDETESLKRSVREIESRLTGARIRNVELDGLSAKVKSEIEHGNQLCAEAERMIQSNKERITWAEKAIDDSKHKNEDLEKELERCFVRRSELKEKLLQIEGSIGEVMSESNRIEQELSKNRDSNQEQLADLHKLDMEFIEIDSFRKSIGERLRLEFSVTSIEPEPLPEGQTAESLREQAEAIRAGLGRMEPVNLMAAEDYERENDRLNFLIRQREDLQEAKSSLQEAILRINSTAEKRFMETFESIKKNFQKVFIMLFDNGEARVELVEPFNPLESPIKILARPGGKKLLSVAQLSGGERALTAISLLFAIYLVKPSPFCILDEVDAPLDDANLLRFLKLIKDFARDTQFIIITHNKLTMEASDILYGVTMEKPGVSKVVSVKFGGNGDGDKGQEDV